MQQPVPDLIRSWLPAYVDDHRDELEQLVVRLRATGALPAQQRPTGRKGSALGRIFGRR